MEVVTVVEFNRIDKFERPRLAFPPVRQASNTIFTVASNNHRLVLGFRPSPKG